jgi:hypothetical protein
MLVIIKIVLFLGCDDAMNSEDGDSKMWQEGGENCVIRRFMIVLFTRHCSKILILRSCILHFVGVYALFVRSQLNARKNSASHISCHF